MSFWYEPKLEDMDITEDGKELHVHIKDDYSGAVYVSINVSDIKKLLKSLKKG